jgi:hypothetical protein
LVSRYRFDLKIEFGDDLVQPVPAPDTGTNFRDDPGSTTDAAEINLRYAASSVSMNDRTSGSSKANGQQRRSIDNNHQRGNPRSS